MPGTGSRHCFWVGMDALAVLELGLASGSGTRNSRELPGNCFSTGRPSKEVGTASSCVGLVGFLYPFLITTQLKSLVTWDVPLYSEVFQIGMAASAL